MCDYLPRADNFYRKTFVEVNLQAIAQNAAIVRQCCPNDVRLMAVVKANAYGHGAEIVARHLSDCNAVDGFAVTLVEEGLQLRRSKATSLPILVMAGCYAEAYTTVLEHVLIPVVSNTVDLIGFSNAAKELGIVAHVHIEVDIGMSRLGFKGKDLDELVAFARELDGVKIVGVMGHPFQAHLLDWQQNCVAKAKRLLTKPHWCDSPTTYHLRCNSDSSSRSSGSLMSSESTSLASSWSSICEEDALDVEEEPISHIANSGVLSASADGSKETLSQTGMTRVGLALYGVQSNDDESEQMRGLIPALSWHTQVVGIRMVEAGESVGYEAGWTARRQCTIATIAVGYADGFPRALSNKGTVWLRGKRAPVVGRICMDYTMIDVSHIHGVKVGTDVVLIGKSDGSKSEQPPSAKEVAQLANTISWEILCRISNRVQRIYV